MKVLVLGSGGREHALAWKIKQSPLVDRLYVSPGNGGTEENVSPESITRFCKDEGIDLVVIGPDDLLAQGMADSLHEAGVLAFGPTRAAAQIEWSKAYAKELMQAAGVPTARSAVFDTYDTARRYVESHALPVVIKASGLALGKGVVIADSVAAADAALRACFLDGRFGEAGKEVVVEEYMEGVEFSVHAICAGEDAILFPSSQDHKRIFENDQGPNTGGMGTVAPLPRVSADVMEDIRQRIILPTLKELKRRGHPFNGLLYPGIMLTSQGPKVIEFNARFGDPETQVYMRLMNSDIVPVLLAAAKGRIAGATIDWHEGAAACVVMASAGYPGAYDKGKEIMGIESVPDGVVVFHAGTKRVDEKLLTNGGRVLNVTAVGQSLQDALARAYEGVRQISFEGAQYRSDIGVKAR